MFQVVLQKQKDDVNDQEYSKYAHLQINVIIECSLKKDNY